MFTILNFHQCNENDSLQWSWIYKNTATTNQWFFFIGQKSVKKFYTGLEIGFLWLCGGEYTCLENENKFNSELKFNELWTICFTKTILKSDEAPKFLKFVWWKNM